MLALADRFSAFTSACLDLVRRRPGCVDRTNLSGRCVGAAGAVRRGHHEGDLGADISACERVAARSRARDRRARTGAPLPLVAEADRRRARPCARRAGQRLPRRGCTRDHWGRAVRRLRRRRGSGLYHSCRSRDRRARASVGIARSLLRRGSCHPHPRQSACTSARSRRRSPSTLRPELSHRSH